jgi:predicted thioesterase
VCYNRFEGSFGNFSFVRFFEGFLHNGKVGALTDGQTSVGTQISVEHTAASPVGVEVAATATVTAVDGRKVEFKVTASEIGSSVTLVGRGTHTRVIVDAERFMTKVGTRI